MNESQSTTIEQSVRKIRSVLRPMYPDGEVEGFIRIIFRHVLHYEPVDILLRKDTVLPDFIVDKINKVVSELQERRPIQYVFNEARFHGHDFYVDESVLIPRPETEELVDMIVDENRSSDLSVLDAGTGSGCIAVSLALALKFAEITAIDISEAAIGVARMNAERLKAKVGFLCQDMLDMPVVSGKYDIIVSNPPYVAEGEKKEMDGNVLDYEPGVALFVPDDDPLRYYRALSDYGKSALKYGGRLYFEINSRFPDEMKALLEGDGYENVELRRDMQGLWRFVRACKRKE